MNEYAHWQNLVTEDAIDAKKITLLSCLCNLYQNIKNIR